MKRTAILLGLLFTFGSSLLQAQGLTQQEPLPNSEQLLPDTLSLLPADSITVTGEIDTLVISDSGEPVMTTDTLLIGTVSDAFFAPSHNFRPTPRKAVIYSA